jgi:TolB-like protein/Tfp pilus assembly protein PilF
MRSYAGQQVDAAKLGTELGVRYVLEGNLRRIADAWRVNVELIDPPSRLPVWSTRIEWKNDDLLSLGDDIVYRLGRELQFVVYRTESERASSSPDRSALRNMGWTAIFDHARQGLPALTRAHKAFTKLLDQYPDDPGAKAGLGAYHALVGSLRLVADWKQHLEQGEKLLRPLVDDRPNNSGPFFYLSIIERMNGRTAEAIRLLERCIELTPSQAPCYAHLGHALVQLGRAGEGIEHIRYALRLSPQDVTRSHWLRFAGEAEIELKNYGEALALLRQSYVLNPHQQPTLRSLAAVNALSGNIDEARRYLAELASVAPKNSTPPHASLPDHNRHPELARGLEMARTPSHAAAEPPQSPEPSHQTADSPRAIVGSGVAAIMVAPFSVTDQGNERSRLAADLMSDDLANLIGRVGGFRVVSRQTAGSYRGQRIDPTAVGKTLGIRYLLEGNVAVQDENLRANVELIDTTNGQHVWSARYDRSGADLQVIQEEIVRGIGRELQIEITRLESNRDPNDLDEHTLIYKGWVAISAAAREGAPALERAEKYFAQVLAREPNSTRAMTGLAACHIQMAGQLSTSNPAPHLAKAEAFLKHAMELRPDVGGPSRFRGIIEMARGRPELAIPWFEREIERNPGHPSAYAHVGHALVRTGKPEEGLKQILYAMRLSPRDPEMFAWLGFAGIAEIALTHDDKAIEYLDRSLALQPKQPRTLLVMAAAQALTGNLDGAQLRHGELQKLVPPLSNEKLIERLFGTAKGPGGERLAQALQAVLGPAADPWASPRPTPTASSEKGAASERAIIPVLVLPFKTFAEGAGSTELLADMVTDDLTNLLSRVQFMRVVSRQTALTFKGHAIDVAAVGAELQVRYVLDGSMRMQGDKLRVNVELIDPKTRLPVWSTRLERDGADPYGTVDEIVGRLARELQFDISAIESARRSDDADADALVYRGWAALTQINLQGYKQAESYFKQALERDPQNLSAELGLGAYHARIGVHLLDDDPDAHREKAREILEDVIRRDPRSGAAYSYLGLVLGVFRTLPQSVEAYKRAIELNPSNASAHAQIGHALARTGQPAEGLEHIRYAMRLSPRDPIMPAWFEFVGNAELELYQFEQAAESFRRSTMLNPGYPRAWAGLAAAHALAGRSDEARRDVQKLRAFAPTLNAQALLKRFGRHKTARITEGLELALAAAEATDAAVRTSKRSTPQSEISR